MRNGNGRPGRREVETRIHDLRATGTAQTAIAAQLGISIRTVRHVIRPEAAVDESRRGREKTATRRDAIDRARSDIEDQLRYDRARGSPQAVLGIRWGAVRDAMDALAAGEAGAHLGLRGALVDLSAISWLLAEELPLDAGADPFAEADAPDQEPIAA